MASYIAFQSNTADTLVLFFNPDARKHWAVDTQDIRFWPKVVGRGGICRNLTKTFYVIS